MSAALLGARALLAVAGLGSIVAIVQFARTDDSLLVAPSAPRGGSNSGEKAAEPLAAADRDPSFALAALVSNGTIDARDIGFSVALLPVRVAVRADGTFEFVDSEETLAARVRTFVGADPLDRPPSSARSVILIVEALGSSSGPRLFDRTLGDAPSWQAASDLHLVGVRAVAALAARLGARAVCAFPNGARLLDPKLDPEMSAARLETWRKGLAAVRSHGVEVAAAIPDAMAELVPEDVAELDLRIVLAPAVVDGTQSFDRVQQLAAAASRSPEGRLLAVDAGWRRIPTLVWNRAARR